MESQACADAQRVQLACRTVALLQPTSLASSAGPFWRCAPRTILFRTRNPIFAWTGTKLRWCAANFREHHPRMNRPRSSACGAYCFILLKITSGLAYQGKVFRFFGGEGGVEAASSEAVKLARP